MQIVVKDMKHDILLFVGLLAGFAALGGFISHVDAQTQESSEGEQTFCPAVYQPVCGAVEVQCVTAPCPPVLETFGNECELERAGAEFYHSGACKPGETYQDSGASEGDTTKPQQPAEAPRNCRVWFDGCNTCQRSSIGGPLACTKRACLQEQDSVCREYFSERTEEREQGSSERITERPIQERELPVGEQREQETSSMEEVSREIRSASEPFSLTSAFNRFPQWLVQFIGQWF